MVTDVHGYGDVSACGAPDVRMPHIDRLAAEGMVFTAMRANATVCSPSRAALLTGRYPDRVGDPAYTKQFGTLDVRVCTPAELNA